MADRRYETLVLIHPELGEPGAKELTARIQTLAQEQGATISQVQEWGVRELSYLIDKQRRAFFVLFEYRATPSAVLELERNLKLMEQVLRLVSVRQAENAPPAPAQVARRPEREHVEEEGLGDLEAGLGEEVS
jgi:small subunit ribosomal protein S6